MNIRDLVRVGIGVTESPCECKTLKYLYNDNKLDLPDRDFRISLDFLVDNKLYTFKHLIYVWVDVDEKADKLCLIILKENCIDDFDIMYFNLSKVEYINIASERFVK